MLRRDPCLASAGRGWGRSKSAAWRGVAGLVVLGTLLFTPTVAGAVFSGSTSKAMSVATAKLAAPTAPQTAWSATCERSTQGNSLLTVTITSYAKVAGANRHELTVFYPGNTPMQTKVLAAGQTQYPFTGNSRSMSGTMTYEIRGSYVVPGSTNVWQGPPLTRTVTCP